MSFDPKQGTLDILKKRYAEASKRSIFFVGAGGSAEVGMPTWDELAKGILKAVDESVPASAMGEELLEAYHNAEFALKKREYWKLFGIIESKWHTLYEDYLSEVFSPQRLERLDIPAVYKRIWRMRNVNQVMTLNIDGLLCRAFDAVKPSSGAKLQEFPGTSISDSRSYLDRNHPVVLHLHGVYSQRTSWVMREQERAKLFTGFERQDYKAFLKHIFQSFNVIFLGVNIRDKAISPVIEEISGSGLLQDHFWITPSISTESYAWAQKFGVRVINYTPDNSDSGSKVHSPSICAILDEVEKFKSGDLPVQLPDRKAHDGTNFPQQAELLAQTYTNHLEMRALLDQRIEQLGRLDGFDGKSMASFIQNYATSLEIASICGTTPPYNFIDRHTLTTIVSESNMSSVWLGSSKDGVELAAIKTLSGQAFKDKIERDSFRRGIESLYHLNSINSPVAPRYYYHTNVPLGVAMEFIAGTSMAELMSLDRELMRNSWYQIFINLAKAVLTCHISEAEVLHRDIKPKNVLFENIYVGCDARDLEVAPVRLINFDMSWHKFSAGSSKSVSADEIGYYAPEQRNFANTESPRTAKTDVYMLGMTLLALLSESPPPEGGSRLKDWSDYVQRKVGSRLDRDPLTANRISRLIILMTSLISEDRPDLQQVIAELTAIRSTIDGEWEKADPDLFIEKLLVECGFDYRWDDQALVGKIETPRQIDLTLGYLPRGQRAELKWMRQRDDGAERRNFGGKLGEVADQIRKQLADAGWQVEPGGGHHGRSLSANIPIRELTRNMVSSAAMVSKIVGRLMSEIR